MPRIDWADKITGNRQVATLSLQHGDPAPDTGTRNAARGERRSVISVRRGRKPAGASREAHETHAGDREDRAGDGARLPRKEARRGDGRDRPEPQEQPAPGRADPDLKQRKPGPEQSAPTTIPGPDITTSTLPRRVAGSGYSRHSCAVSVKTDDVRTCDDPRSLIVASASEA